ncbi:MAG: dihydrodipicolinate synthase family protein [Sphaerochaetaceae bacterium]|nr:dihydrodipicolinate synthase family protein [Sphaerochaetaceae bacterium]
MKYKMKGCIPPMVTPFDRQGNVDEPELRKLVRFLNENVHGIFICGSYGCGPLMNLEERKRVAEICKEEGTKLQIIAMTGTTNTRDTIELTRHAKSIGLDAASAVAPFYFHHNMDDVVTFYGDVISAVGNDFPLYIYTNPKFSGYPVDLKTLRRLKDIGLAGVKAASFDVMEFANIVREFEGEDFDIALGTEALWLPAAVYGSNAFIPGLANAFPEICVDMYNQSCRGDWEACRATQFKINKLRDVMYLAKSTQLAIYAMLEIRGIAHCYPRKPFNPATPVELDNIRKKLIEMGMIQG